VILAHPSVVDIMELERGEIARRLSVSDAWKVVAR
jgi:hypothetical protein